LSSKKYTNGAINTYAGKQVRYFTDYIILVVGSDFNFHWGIIKCARKRITFPNCFTGAVLAQFNLNYSVN